MLYFSLMSKLYGRITGVELIFILIGFFIPVKLYIAVTLIQRLAAVCTHTICGVPGSVCYSTPTCAVCPVLCVTSR